MSDKFNDSIDFFKSHLNILSKSVLLNQSETVITISVP